VTENACESPQNQGFLNELHGESVKHGLVGAILAPTLHKGDTSMPNPARSRSPLERHKQWLLDLVAREPDLSAKGNPRAPALGEEAESRHRVDLALFTTVTKSAQKNSARRRAGSS
jgi:hypothetical protein